MNKKHYLILFLLALILKACIGEDYSNCFNEKYIYFNSVNPKYDFNDFVDQVNLYLYDESEVLLDEFIYYREQIKRYDYKVPVPVQKKGNYSLIALVNYSDHYEVSGKQKLSTWYASLIDNKGIIDFKLNDIYYAAGNIIFVDSYQENDTFDLYKNTNHIHVAIELQKDPLKNSLYEEKNLNVYITGSNNAFNFNNDPFGSEKLVFLSHTTKEESNKFNYSFTIMQLRIGDDNELFIEVEESAGVFVLKRKFNICEELAKIKDDNGNKLYDTNEKLVKEDDFKFNIILGPSYEVLELKINDWYIIKNDIEI